MNTKQEWALRKLCARYGETEFDEKKFFPDFSLPKGWVVGWVGKPKNGNPGALYVGCGPDGNIAS